MAVPSYAQLSVLFDTLRRLGMSRESQGWQRMARDLMNSGTIPKRMPERPGEFSPGDFRGFPGKPRRLPDKGLPGGCPGIPGDAPGNPGDLPTPLYRISGLQSTWAYPRGFGLSHSYSLQAKDRLYILPLYMCNRIHMCLYICMWDTKKKTFRHFAFLFHSIICVMIKELGSMDNTPTGRGSDLFPIR
jgi:hypothetical protein